MTGTQVVPDARALRGLDVALVPSAEAGAALGAQAARELPEGLISCAILTFDGWLGRLWELAGDGRQLVGPSARVLAMSRAIACQDAPELPLRPHTAQAAARALRDAVGLEELDRASAGDARATLAPGERALLSAFAAYERLLEGLGLVEPGRALAVLGRDASRAFARPCRVGVVGTAPPTPQQAQFLRRCEEEGCLSVSWLSGGPREASVDRAPEGVDVGFAFPSGGYAVPQTALRLVDALSGEGPMVVACTRPLELYDALAPALAARGVSCAVRGSRAFGETSFGSAFLALARERDGGELPFDEAALADVAASAVVGRARGGLWRWDEGCREDRLLGRGEAERRVADGDEALGVLLGLVPSPGEAGLAAMDALVERVGFLSRAARDEEHAAIAALRDLVRVARGLGLAEDEVMPSILPLLSSCQLSARGATTGLALGEAPQVLVEGMAEAAATPAGSVASMVVLDLDSEGAPSARRDDACALLLDRLGVPRGETFLASARRRMASLVAAPSRHLVLGRCLNDEQGSPLYPSALLEEFVDCYRTGSSATDDHDDAYGLPACLQGSVLAVGEEDLVGDVRPGHAPFAERPAPAALDEGGRRALLAFRERPSDATSQGTAGGGHPADVPGGMSPEPRIVLSPAQMEAYLACPGYWLATRRLATGAPDESFGPREMGTYRHDVLQAFYERFRALGHRKLSRASMADGRRALDEAFREVDARARELGDDGLPVCRLRRLVAVPGTTEERAVARIREQLADWLDFECGFLPGPAAGEVPGPFSFEPRAFELDLAILGGRGAAAEASGGAARQAGHPGTSKPVRTYPSYAGCAVSGRVDRVDASTDGSAFVVVDYKGVIDADYDLKAPPDGPLVGTEKIQALVYATVLERAGALRAPDGGPARAVGAVYVSYRRGHEIRGSYDASALSRERHLPTLPSGNKGLSPEDFHELLAQVEEAVREQVVGPLAEGDVSPRPAADGVCARCPNLGCPARRCPYVP